MTSPEDDEKLLDELEAWLGHFADQPGAERIEEWLPAFRRARVGRNAGLKIIADLQTALTAAKLTPDAQAHQG